MELIFIIFFIILLINKRNLSSSILKTSFIFIKDIMPNLIPSIVLSNALKIGKVLKIILSPFEKVINYILNLNYVESGIIVILSFFVGSPANQILIKNALNQNKIDKKEADVLVLFTSALSPFYLIYITTMVLGNKAVIPILISTYSAILIFGCIVSNKRDVIINNENKSISESSNIIRNTAKSIEIIYISLIIFNLIIDILLKDNLLIFSGLLEMSVGLINLSVINIDYFYKYLLTTFYISFLGLAIIIQSLSINESINKLKYITSRIIIATIALILSIIYYFTNILFLIISVLVLIFSLSFLKKHIQKPEQVKLLQKELKSKVLIE